MSRSNSIISIGGNVYDRNNERVTAGSLKGRNDALDFALKAAKAKRNPEVLRAIHTLVNAGKADDSGRRGSNASIMSTDSTYRVEPSDSGRNLILSRDHTSKGRRPSAAENYARKPIRRPHLEKFSWSGRKQREVDANGNIEETVTASIVIPDVLRGDQGLSMGGPYSTKGALKSTTHRRSRRHMLQEIAEKMHPSKATADEAKRRSS